MTIPSKAFFDEWMALATTPFAEGLNAALKAALREEPPQLTLSLIVSFIESCRTAREARLEMLKKHPVNKWIDSQPGYIRALTLLQPKRRVSLVDDPDSYEQALLYLMNTSDPVLVADKSEMVARRTFRTAWIVGLVAAIRAYVYDDHQAIFLARLNLRKNIEEITRRVQEVEVFLNAERKIAGTTGLVLRRVSSWNHYVDRHPPRNLKTKAEIAFVKEVQRLNRQTFRSDKPQVIAELMSMECFKRSFDERHISRLCREFKEAKAARKAAAEAESA